MGHRKMTPIQSYRFGPATKIVEHSSRNQTNAGACARNRKEKNFRTPKKHVSSAGQTSMIRGFVRG